MVEQKLKELEKLIEDDKRLKFKYKVINVNQKNRSLINYTKNLSSMI